MQSFVARFPALDEVIWLFFKRCVYAGGHIQSSNPRTRADPMSYNTHNEQELLALWRQDKEAMAPIPVGDGPGDAKRHKAGGDDGNGNAAA